MTILGVPLLTALIFLPLVGAAVVFLLPSARLGLVRWTAFAFSTLTFLASIPLWTGFDTTRHGMQFEEHVAWIGPLGISYHLGVDGISALLILLTTFLSAISILSTFTAVTNRVKTYMATLLLLETGMIGVFA